MTWRPACDNCGETPREPGALIVTPPVNHGLYVQLNLCVACWENWEWPEITKPKSKPGRETRTPERDLVDGVTAAIEEWTAGRAKKTKKGRRAG